MTIKVVARMSFCPYWSFGTKVRNLFDTCKLWFVRFVCLLFVRGQRIRLEVWRDRWRHRITLGSRTASQGNKHSISSPDEAATRGEGPEAAQTVLPKLGLQRSFRC